MKVESHTHKSKAEEEKEYQEKVAKVKRTRARILGGALALVLVLLLYFFSGGFRGRVKEREPSQTEQRLIKVAALHRDYSTAMRKTPSDINELKEWTKKLDKQKLATFEIDNVETLFVSDRDQQPFVLDRPPRGIGPILAHERTGSGGKRFVISSVGSLSEEDEASFEQLKETMRGLEKIPKRSR